MIPKRAPYGGQSYKIYEDYNEIHIFVEDAGFENLYKVLFNRYDIKVENIFSKNGKESILKAAKSCSDSKCVFIVDRDWDDLFGIFPKLKNVVVLNMHSIENYLIDYGAFSGIILAESPRCEINSVLGQKHFSKILTNVSEDLRPLFECFASLQMKGNGSKGCSHRPGRFQQKNRSCAPDVDTINQFISDSGVSVPKSVRDYFRDKDLSRKGHGRYMLHFTWEGVRQKSGVGKIGSEKLKIRLAQLINTGELKTLALEVKSRAISH